MIGMAGEKETGSIAAVASAKDLRLVQHNSWLSLITWIIWIRGIKMRGMRRLLYGSSYVWIIMHEDVKNPWPSYGLQSMRMTTWQGIFWGNRRFQSPNIAKKGGVVWPRPRFVSGSNPLTCQNLRVGGWSQFYQHAPNDEKITSNEEEVREEKEKEW